MGVNPKHDHSLNVDLVKMRKIADLAAIKGRATNTTQLERKVITAMLGAFMKDKTSFSIGKIDPKKVNIDNIIQKLEKPPNRSLRARLSRAIDRVGFGKTISSKNLHALANWALVLTTPAKSSEEKSVVKPSSTRSEAKTSKPLSD